MQTNTLLSASEHHSVTLEPTRQVALKIASFFRLSPFSVPAGLTAQSLGHGAVLFTSLDCSVLWGTSRMVEGHGWSQSGSASVRSPQPRVLYRSPEFCLCRKWRTKWIPATGSGLA